VTCLRGDLLAGVVVLLLGDLAVAQEELSEGVLERVGDGAKTMSPSRQRIERSRWPWRTSRCPFARIIETKLNTSGS
jgi:hypothetical protein